MSTQNPKPLIFGPPFPEILFTGEKTKTFRVTGAENFEKGDLISLVYPDLTEFARAQIIDKYLRTFATLTEEDWRGHERFSAERMYQVYSAWEGFKVGPDTPLTVLVYGNFRSTKPQSQFPFPRGSALGDTSRFPPAEVGINE